MIQRWKVEIVLVDEVFESRPMTGFDIAEAIKQELLEEMDFKEVESIQATELSDES